MPHIQITHAKHTKAGLIRLTFLIQLGESQLVLSGYRYKPETGELFPPSFMGRNGGRVATVEARGELAEVMQQMVKDAYSDNGKGL